MTSRKFEDFLTPSSLCHTILLVFLRSSYKVSQKFQPPSPTWVTSFFRSCHGIDSHLYFFFFLPEQFLPAILRKFAILVSTCAELSTISPVELKPDT